MNLARRRVHRLHRPAVHNCIESGFEDCTGNLVAMIAGRLRECLRRLRWDAADLAQELDCPRDHVTRWLEGRTPVPLAVAAWIEALVKAHRALPRPCLKEPISGTHTSPTGPVVVKAFTGDIRHQQPQGIILQSPYPRRNALAGAHRFAAMAAHPKGASAPEPRPL